MPTVDLLRAIQLAPDLLDKITVGEFEELVAEVLAAFGWQVSLTPPTRDGGRDMLAISRTAGIEVRIIVECKRYRPDRPVGIGTIQRLLGVKHEIGAAKALLVTSSRFTRDAQMVANERQWELELVDREKLFKWFSSYTPRSQGQPHFPRQKFESCFLSHSHKDHKFVSYSNTRLKDAGVEVWFAPDDLLPGQKTKEQIDRALAAFDRVIAVLSPESIKSNWVSTELTAALKLELNVQRSILLPVSLMPYLELARWECFNSDLGRDIAVAIREYPVLDFTGWQAPDPFETHFAKLLKGLAQRRAA